MTATMERRRGAGVTEVPETRFEEFAARMDERFERAEEKADERFERLTEQIARVDEKSVERFDALAEQMEARFSGLAEQIARVDEKGVERFDALTEQTEVRFSGLSEQSGQRAVELDRRLGHLYREAERVNDRLDDLVKVYIAGNTALVCGILGGFISIVALILTQG
jgi:DNA anti-recombination protein RmuC